MRFFLHGRAIRRSGLPSGGVRAAIHTVVALLVSTGVAHACSVCGGDPSSPMTAGMNSAIGALLAITGAVVSTLLGFFLFLWRRARSSKRTQIDTAWLDGLRGVKND